MSRLSHLFIDTVSTSRLTTTVNSDGSTSKTFNTNISSLKCRVQQSKGFEPEKGGAKQSELSFIVYCDPDTDILKKDKITYNGTTYNIIELSITPRAYLKFVMEREA